MHKVDGKFVKLPNNTKRTENLWKARNLVTFLDENLSQKLGFLKNFIKQKLKFNQLEKYKD